MSRDPDHPVLDRPWEYEIASFAYERDFDEPEQSTVVVGLRRGRDLVRLCFRGPRDPGRS